MALVLIKHLQVIFDYINDIFNSSLRALFYSLVTYIELQYLTNMLLHTYAS